MKVKIKDFGVPMEIMNRGIELEVKGTDGSHRGDLVITKANVIWCPGRTTRPNGKAVRWDRFIAMMNAED